MGNISIWQLMILLVIVVLVFGTKRLRNLGSDLGGAVKGFRKGLEEVEEVAEEENQRLEAASQDSATAEQKSEHTDQT